MSNTRKLDKEQNNTILYRVHYREVDLPIRGFQEGSWSSCRFSFVLIYVHKYILLYPNILTLVSTRTCLKIYGISLYIKRDK